MKLVQQFRDMRSASAHYLAHVFDPRTRPYFQIHKTSNVEKSSYHFRAMCSLTSLCPWHHIGFFLTVSEIHYIFAEEWFGTFNTGINHSNLPNAQDVRFSVWMPSGCTGFQLAAFVTRGFPQVVFLVKRLEASELGWNYTSLKDLG